MDDRPQRACVDQAADGLHGVGQAGPRRRHLAELPPVCLCHSQDLVHDQNVRLDRQRNRERQAAINVAEGEKQAQVLAAEADRAEQILQAEGEARAIEMVAKAKAMALETIGKAAATSQGQKAVQLDLATRAIQAKQEIAKQSTVVLMDGKGSEAGNVVAEAVAIVSAMNRSEAFAGQTQP